MKLIRNLALTLFLLSSLFLFSQKKISKPLSFEYGLKPLNEEVVIQNNGVFRNQSNKLEPLQAGYILNAGNLSSEWHISYIDDLFIARIRIKVPLARALNIYTNNYEYKEKEHLYIYNSLHEEARAYNFKDGKIVSDFVSGDELTVEFISSEHLNEVPFKIKEVGVLINDGRGFGDAGDCEVRINCIEGEKWQSQKKGIARILVRDGSQTFWCTGSLINNTNNDRKPYFLTANHCGINADSLDYSEWQFYFNFEAPSCGAPPLEPEYNLVTGALLLAKSKYGTNAGSDFKLLKLAKNINPLHAPYYNGWDRRDIASSTGVTIHHPQGDVKMISTYTSPLISTNYDSDIQNPSGMYWKVEWAETESGHGVTEGGSSGSPLFNNEGYIVGTLTGGRASCINPDLADFYGKFSFSYQGIPNDSTSNLAYWLDPGSTGAMVLQGSDFDSTTVFAGFSAEKKVIAIGGSVEFINTSYGKISGYSWEFEGGEPQNSELKEPGFVKYNKAGEFDVKLTVSSSFGSDTLFIPDYITVLPNISPNPSEGIFKISFGGNIPEDLSMRIYNSFGSEISYNIIEEGEDFIIVNIFKTASGLHIVSLIQNNNESNYKILITK